MPENYLAPRIAPDSASYSPEELYLSPRWRRDLFRQSHGVQAPPWDRARQIQRWWDSKAAALPPEGQYVYQSWVLVQGVPSYKTFVITNGEAASPNLPGLYDFPKWNPAPLRARMHWFGEMLPPPAPDAFCLESEAFTLAKELGGFVQPGGLQPPDPGSLVYEPTEQRRPWVIVMGQGENRREHSAGLLLRMKSLHGIGAPGHWDFSNKTQPGWVTETQQTGEQDTRPEVPIPMRPLESFEEFMPHPFSLLSHVIVRKDKMPKPTGGGASQEEMIQAVMEGIKRGTPDLAAAIHARILGLPR